MNLEKIEALVAEQFEAEEFADCFLVEIKFISSTNTLRVFIDSDSGLNTVLCRKLSRHIESYLDESQALGEKYVLEVSSPGLEQPLQLLRQYQKNIGRTLKLNLKEGKKQEGKLVAVTETAVTLEQEVITRIKKKKIKELVQTAYPFDNIEKAKIKISFK